MNTFRIFFFLLLLIAVPGFSAQFELDNMTAYPKKNAKIAIQWANSAKEVDESNKALIHGGKLNVNTLQHLKQTGKISIKIPAGAQYFRMLVWTHKDKSPDLHTNWVDIISNKTYVLKEDQLVPSILMQGMGC